MDSSSKTKTRERKTVYPKVKVREQGLDDGGEVFDQKRGYLMSLKDVEYLSLHDPVKEDKLLTPMLIARIPKSYSPKVAKDSTLTANGVEKDNERNEENRPNIRVSSIPPPRAVVSSRENDEVIGNINKIQAENRVAIKDQDALQNRHTSRSTTCSIYARNTTCSRKSQDFAYHDADLTKKKESTVKVSKPKRKPKPERPAWQDP